MYRKNLNLKDYKYHLPDDKIAKFPLEDRSASKLLFYRQGQISHHTFKNIDELIPDESLLIFNDTKVIPARLIFEKSTGASIEVFLLDPIDPSTLHDEILASTSKCTWKCMIGNAKKWKIGSSIFSNHKGLDLVATREDQQVVSFEWRANISFSEVIQQAGKVPLPPYLNRESEAIDQPRYQTIYSKFEGAVAAPTAGLHFSEEVVNKLQKKNIQSGFLTLHVSAGTFQPIKSGISEHPMHNEQVVVSRSLVEQIANTENIICVGTTSLRTIESLYWFGVKLEMGNNQFNIGKMMPYSSKKSDLSKKKSLSNVLAYMDENGIDKLSGNTEIFIFPGYQFRIAKGLVTNFHLPSSTLILLVAAFIGKDWKEVYNQALENDYRFLSYGDSSLLIPSSNH